MRIVEDDLSGDAIAKLITAHVTEARAVTPEGFSFALDLASLRAPDMTFWSAWIGGELAGMAALKDLGDGHGEVKSMRTAADFQRRGVAAALLAHLVAVARARGWTRLSLETGTSDDYAAARALYARFGFVPCAPFGDYPDSPHNICYTMEL